MLGTSVPRGHGRGVMRGAAAQPGRGRAGLPRGGNGPHFALVLGCSFSSQNLVKLLRYLLLSGGGSVFTFIEGIYPRCFYLDNAMKYKE